MKKIENNWSDNITVLATVGSTNDYAKALERQAFHDREVVLARSQSAGRGTFGKRWFSPLGGIYMSLTLTLDKPVPLITLMTAFAVRSALSGLYHVDFEIKWPNDLLLFGKKVCGILTERVEKGDGRVYIVVGIGINLDLPRQELEAARADAGNIGDLTGRELEIEQVAARVLDEFAKYFEAMQNGQEILTMDNGQLTIDN